MNTINIKFLLYLSFYVLAMISAISGKKGSREKNSKLPNAH